MTIINSRVIKTTNMNQESRVEGIQKKPGFFIPIDIEQVSQSPAK